MDPTAMGFGLEAARLGQAAAAVRLPSPVLPGWQGLCAEEYAVAVLRLATATASAVLALEGAAALLAAGA